MQDAPARGLHAGLGRYSGLPGEILDHVSQGIESVAHELVHPIVQTGPLAQSKPSCAKESDPVRERSALALDDRELLCKGFDLHDVWDGFLCQ